MPSSAEHRKVFAVPSSSFPSSHEHLDIYMLTTIIPSSRTNGTTITTIPLICEYIYIQLQLLPYHWQMVLDSGLIRESNGIGQLLLSFN